MNLQSRLRFMTGTILRAPNYFCPSKKLSGLGTPCQQARFLGSPGRTFHRDLTGHAGLYDTCSFDIASPSRLWCLCHGVKL